MLVYLGATYDPMSTNAITTTNLYIQPLTTAYAYDPNGNQVAVVDALQHETDYVYDTMNRVVQTLFPAAGTNAPTTAQTLYDGLGHKIRQTDQAGVTTAFEYNDGQGLLTAVTLDWGGTNSLLTRYAYDQAGNLATQTDANGNLTAFQYDALGRRTARTLPGGATESTAYADVPEGGTNTALRVAQTAVTDFRGKTITNTLDRLDRAAARFLPAINPGETNTIVTYRYDTNGLLSRVDMAGQVTRTNYYFYDPLRRLVQKDTPEGVLAYGYATNGDLLGLAGYRRAWVPVGGAIPTNAGPDVCLAYAYDQLGRLLWLTNGGLARSNVTAYAYDAVGNLAGVMYPNGLTHNYTYSPQNRLTALALNRGDGSLLRSFAYGLDPAGHRVACWRATPSTGCGSACARRLTSMITTTT